MHDGTARFWSKLLKLGLLAALVGHLLLAPFAESKLIDVTLGELVQGSDFIALVYGEPNSRASLSSRSVGVRIIELLKGSRGPSAKDIRLCNRPDDVESHDMRKIPGQFVVFASKHMRCYLPIHGISSIIIVQDDVAGTSAISDQPSVQPIQEFLGRIRLSVAEHAADQ